MRPERGVLVAERGVRRLLLGELGLQLADVRDAGPEDDVLGAHGSVPDA